jgi:hypothetical protein
MTLASLLAAALLFCSLPGLTPDHPKQGSVPDGAEVKRDKAFFFDRLDPAATPSEPWRIFSDRTADVQPGYNALDPAQLDQYRFDQINGDAHVRRFKLYPLPGTLVVDSNGPTCYAIRSYVVARDSKDSDSTHPAGYSTCQPSNRYQVKSADLRVVSGDR